MTADYWGAMRFWWESFERSLSVSPVFRRLPVLGPPNPTCVAAARNTGIAIGGTVGGYVGATSGAFGGGVGGSAVAPGVGTLFGAYTGSTTGFGIGSAGGAVTGGFLGAAAGNILCASSASGGDGGSGGGAGGGGHRNAGKTVAEILKGKKASIKNAPLDAGGPTWTDILSETWESIDRGARAGRPGYATSQAPF